MCIRFNLDMKVVLIKELRSWRTLYRELTIQVWKSKESWRYVRRLSRWLALEPDGTHCTPHNREVRRLTSRICMERTQPAVGQLHPQLKGDPSSSQRTHKIVTNAIFRLKPVSFVTDQILVQVTEFQNYLPLL